MRLSPARESMDFKILGPSRSGTARAVPIRGRKQRLVVARCSCARTKQSHETLAEALWREARPKDAAHALDVQISRLRRRSAIVSGQTPAATRSTSSQTSSISTGSRACGRRRRALRPSAQRPCCEKPSRCGEVRRSRTSPTSVRPERACPSRRAATARDRGPNWRISHWGGMPLVPELDELVSRHPFRAVARKPHARAVPVRPADGRAARLRRDAAPARGRAGPGARRGVEAAPRPDPEARAGPRASVPLDQPRRVRGSTAVAKTKTAAVRRARSSASRWSRRRSGRCDAVRRRTPTRQRSRDPERRAQLDRLRRSRRQSPSRRGSGNRKHHRAGQSGFAFGEGAVWVATYSGLLVKIDPARGA